MTTLKKVEAKKDGDLIAVYSKCHNSMTFNISESNNVNGPYVTILGVNPSFIQKGYIASEAVTMVSRASWEAVVAKFYPAPNDKSHLGNNYYLREGLIFIAANKNEALAISADREGIPQPTDRLTCDELVGGKNAGQLKILSA